MNTFRTFWNNYHSEVIFGIVLGLIVIASTYLSQFITGDLFDLVITPALNVATSTVAFVGAWLIFRHSEGLLARRIWGFTLLAWGLGDLFYLVCYLVAPMQVMNMGATQLTTVELMVGNLLGWMMTLYPTATLRPGWLRWKIVLCQVVPMILLVLLDYLIPLDLWPIVALYPYGLFIMVLTHIRAYQRWCENNFSSMDHIDTQWIIRYSIMFFIIGANYIYMCTTHDHTRGLTQQWFVIFMLVYSTDEILYRKDPWAGLSVMGDGESVCQSEGRSVSDNGLTSNSDNGLLLQQWMEQQKPYLNPEFKLMDLRAVLPMNRTYLSQLINSTYGCSFYQFVNRYRIEETKRLMQDHPEMKAGEIASRAGFSSREAFARTFSNMTGMAPGEWRRECNNS